MVWGKKKNVVEEVKKEVAVVEKLVEPVKKEIVQEEERYSLESVATQTSNVIYDKATDEKLELQDALVLILNKLDKLEQLLN